MLSIVLKRRKAVLKVASLLLSRLYTYLAFRPRSIEIYHKSRLESEGGVCLLREDISKIYAFAEPKAVHALLSFYVYAHRALTSSMVIVIEGHLLENAPARLIIYLTDEYRRVYGDIEFDVMPTSEVSSLVDIYEKNPDVAHRLYKIVFFVGMASRESIKYIVVGRDPDAHLYVNNAVILYTPDADLYREKLIKTLSTVRAVCTEMPDDLLEASIAAAAALEPGVSLEIYPSHVAYRAESLETSERFIKALCNAQPTGRSS